MRRYLDRRSVWMGFRNELGFRFAFVGTRDIFGDENDHHLYLLLSYLPHKTDTAT
jgi:hypothetical protein